MGFEQVRESYAGGKDRSNLYDSRFSERRENFLLRVEFNS